MTLIEMIIVVAIIGLVTSAVAVAAYRHFEQAKLETAESTARVLRGAVQGWWLRGNTGCPSLDELMASGVVDAAASRVDPWQKPWSISCDGNAIAVASGGPDGQLATEDDIRVPSLP